MFVRVHVGLADAESAALPVRCLHPEVLHNPLAFFNSSCRLADSVGVQLPPAAGEALLCRGVRELALPQVITLCTYGPSLPLS